MTRQPAESGAADPARVKRWRELLASERDAAALYSRLAEAETGERRKIFEELAGVERRHAGHWEGKLADAGARVPPPGRSSLRTTAIAALLVGGIAAAVTFGVGHLIGGAVH